MRRPLGILVERANRIGTTTTSRSNLPLPQTGELFALRRS